MKVKRRNTGLNAVLADMDEVYLPNAKTKFFSIAFIVKSGEYVFLRKAKLVGLRKHLQNKDFKAVQAVNNNGNDIGHIYPVWIHSIVKYSGNITFEL